MNAVADQIDELAQSGERMIERLRRKAFRPKNRNGLNMRYSIAEATQLPGCSSKRIRMAEGRGAPPPRLPKMTAVPVTRSRDC